MKKIIEIILLALGVVVALVCMSLVLFRYPGSAFEGMFL